MPAGYSGTPLPKKLGLKPGFRICALDEPPHYGADEPPHYGALLGDLPEGAEQVPIQTGGLDFVHIFATETDRAAELLALARPNILPNGMIWISWPKKASGVPTELDSNGVRHLGLSSGLVDVKVCAVDETWSALKFVIRLEDRP